MKLLKDIGNRLLQILIAFDQLCNACTPGGWADETLSSRAHRLYELGNKWPKRFVNLLFFWQKDHCKEAYESEKLRFHLPPEFRDIQENFEIEGHMIEIEELSTTPKVWILRLDGDGNTFNAVCTVVHKDDDTVEAKGACSRVAGGVLEILLKSSKYFLKLGYSKLSYKHNGKDVVKSIKK